MVALKLAADARMIIITISGFGDHIVMTPALRALRETYTYAHIDCIVRSDTAREFISTFGFFNQIFVWGEALDEMDVSNPAQTIKFGQHLRTNNYDVAIFLGHILLPIAPFLRALMTSIGAKYLVGLDSGNSPFLHIKVPDKGFGAQHEAEYYQNLVKAVGAVVRDRQPFLPIENEFRQQAKAFLATLGDPSPNRPLIAMHPGCSSFLYARRWPPEHFAALADQLYQKYGGQLLLVGGPEEASLREQVLQAMHSQMPRCSLPGTESFFLTAAILEQCDLFIGNDSGLMHAAAAVSTPTLGIFGLTNSRAWGPYTPAVPSRSCVVHRQDLSCLPCQFVNFDLGNGWGCASCECLTQLSVEMVAEVACQFLLATSTQ